MGKSYWEWDPVFNLNPAKSALLVIDMQNGFIDEGSPLEVPMAREQVPTLRKLISFCRSQNIPVIYTKFCVGTDFRYDFYWKIAKQRGIPVSEPECSFWDGKHETEIISELAPIPGERIIKKCGYDCFAGTELEQILQSLGVTNLLVSGTVLNWCVDSTVRTAYHRHYDVTVISDGVSTYDHGGATAEQWHKMELNLIAEAFGRVLSTDETINELTKNGSILDEKEHFTKSK